MAARFSYSGVNNAHAFVITENSTMLWEVVRGDVLTQIKKFSGHTISAYRRSVLSIEL